MCYGGPRPKMGSTVVTKATKAMLMQEEGSVWVEWVWFRGWRLPSCRVIVQEGKQLSNCLHYYNFILTVYKCLEKMYNRCLNYDTFLRFLCKWVVDLQLTTMMLIMCMCHCVCVRVCVRACDCTLCVTVCTWLYVHCVCHCMYVWLYVHCVCDCMYTVCVTVCTLCVWL